MHVEGGGWFPTLDGEVRSSASGLTGDLISESDIGIDDPDVVLQGGITFRIAQRHSIRLHGFGFSLDGDANTNRTFNFDGQTYPVATRVTSEADAAFFGADYGFDVVHTEPVAIGLSLGARFLSAKASIAAPLLGLEGEGELEAALPALGLNVILHPFAPVPLLRSVALVARVAGGTIGEAGSFIDLDGGVEWLPIPVLAIRVGYRYFHGQGEDGGQEAEIDLSGPYASLTLAF
ncbi:MAG: hypothetical protein ACREJR_05440 [Candidatus Rokuibacteriota bacterium]